MSDLFEFFDVSNIQGLGADNVFSRACTQVVKNAANAGVAFGIHRVYPGGLDLAKIEGGSGKTVGNSIMEVLNSGDNDLEDNYAIAIYRYLLHGFACYVEVPKTRYKEGQQVQDFDKFIATSNVEIIANWMEIPLEDAQAKFGRRVAGAIESVGVDNTTAYVKMEAVRGGTRKVIRPHKDLDLSTKGVKVVPLIFLQTYVDTLFEKMGTQIVGVTFEKDNGQIRVLNTTTNREILEGIYGSGDFVDMGINSAFKGDWDNLDSIHRGHVKVPEVGLDKWDHPTRVINYARILSVNFEPEVDLSYINVDLTQAQSEFERGLEKLSKRNVPAAKIVRELVNIGFDGSEWFNTDGSPKEAPSVESIISWSQTMNSILGTDFRRLQHSFMLLNQQWFQGYTGAGADIPSEVFEYSTTSVDAEPEMFEFVTPTE